MLTQTIAWQVRRKRKAKGWSARNLSDMCHVFGHDMPRSVIADLENGRRQSISVMELIVLARVLDVSPVDLVYPLELADGQVTPRPVEPAVVLDARDWWRGSSADSGPIRDAEETAIGAAAIAAAMTELRGLIAKLAEQQEALDVRVAEFAELRRNPSRGVRASATGQERGAMQIEMLQALAALRSTGVEVPAEAMWLLERELPFGILRGSMSCPNSHDVPAGHRYCPECGARTVSSDDEEPAVVLSRLHLQSLRKMCRDRGLADVGGKDELIARLTT